MYDITISHKEYNKFQEINVLIMKTVDINDYT